MKITSLIFCRKTPDSEHMRNLARYLCDHRVQPQVFDILCRVRQHFIGDDRAVADAGQTQRCHLPAILIVYFGDLFWRSIGTVGHGSIYSFENDTGPDDCNHAQFGIVIKHDPDADMGPGGRELHGLQLMDMAPTILKQFDVPVPADMQGRAF